MILVTVGTHEQPFDRLIKKVDELVRDKKIKNVLAQVGYSNYKPKYIKKWFDFVEYQKMEELFKKSNLVITHSGIGSVMLSLKFKKPMVIVPRMKKFREHTDDHQLQLAREMEKRNITLVVYDIEKLEDAIRKIKKLKYKLREKSKIPIMIKNHLDNLG